MNTYDRKRWDVTIRDWRELLEKRFRKWEESLECFRRFRDDDSVEWVNRDFAEVNEESKKFNSILSNLIERCNMTKYDLENYVFELENTIETAKEKAEKERAELPHNGYFYGNYSTALSRVHALETIRHYIKERI